MSELFPNVDESGADFSPCRTWRYALWRRWAWNERANVCAFIGINPSTADETKNDPTITRCMNFAKSWGFDGIYMLNLFAYRATKVEDMWKARTAGVDVVGPGNNEALRYYRSRVSRVVAAWGAKPKSGDRGLRVCELLNVPIHCLRKTKSGWPEHPLYMPGDVEPFIFWEATP